MSKSQRNLEKREEIENTKEEIKLIARTTKKKLRNEICWFVFDC